ncbi:MAG TPA: hypothetical protein VFO60_05895 [Candidatus Dormibacteraeota bacterium]|nr:hypothetical protein [Candidatus Dormibacteraeota bacterium]
MATTAADILAYERAARAVFAPLAALLASRSEREAAGRAPDAVDEPAQLADLAVWSGGACYLIADAIVAAAGGPQGTATHPETAAWVVTALRSVEDWTLAATDTVRMQTLRLPGRPPEPAPGATGETMARAAVAVLGAVQGQVAGDLFALRRRLPPDDARLRAAAERVTHAEAVLHFARPLVGIPAGAMSAEQATGLVDRALPAIVEVFQAGQAVAAPVLLGDLDAAPASPAPAQGPPSSGAGRAAPTARRWAEPGSASFDPWCLTDPHALVRLRTADHRTVLDAMWRLPGAATLVALQNLLEESLARGDIAHAQVGHGRYAGYFHRAPWAPVYETARDLRLGTTRVAAHATFTFAVGELDPEPSLPRIAVDTFTAGADGSVRGTLARTVAPPQPGSPGFDPWALTDPRARRGLQRRPERAAELEAVWSGPQAQSLLATADALAVAALQGHVRPAQNPNGTWRPPLRDAPWPPVWVTRDAVTVAGTRLRAGVEVALSPGGDGLVTGPFEDRDLLGAPETAPAAPPPHPTATPPAREVRPPAPTLPAPVTVGGMPLERPARTPRRASGDDPPAAARPSPLQPAPDAPAAPSPATPSPAAAPVFDLETHRWALTDPHARARLRRDPDALSRIDAFWAADGEPSASVAAGRAVEDALARGDLAYAVQANGTWAPPMDEPPFAARLVTRRPQTLLGTPLPEGQPVALEVTHSPHGTVRRMRRLR